MAKTTSTEKRKRFYNEGESRLVRLGIVKSGYICPLCLEVYEIAEIESGKNLTIEHVPQYSAGGKEFCLTCKECNGVFSSKEDSTASDFAKLTRIGEMLKETGSTKPQKVEFEWEGITFRGKLQYTDGKAEFTIDAKHQHPDKIPKLHKAFQETKEKLEEKGEKPKSPIATTQIDIENFKRSALKNSYYLFFGYFGYSGITNGTLINARNYLLRKSDLGNKINFSPKKHNDGIYICDTKKIVGVAIGGLMTIFFLDQPYSTFEFNKCIELPNFPQYTLDEILIKKNIIIKDLKDERNFFE